MKHAYKEMRKGDLETEKIKLVYVGKMKGERLQ